MIQGYRAPYFPPLKAPVVNTNTGLRPHGNRILVRPLKPKTETPGGILLTPSALKGKSEWGEVVAVGSGKLTDDGLRVKPDIYVGEIVMLAVWGGTEIEQDGETLLAVNADEVLAVRTPGKTK